jgi:hypothetical protein
MLIIAIQMIIFLSLDKVKHESRENSLSLFIIATFVLEFLGTY